MDAVVITKDGMIPVDAKFSLDNYRRLVDATNDLEKEQLEKNESIEVVDYSKIYETLPVGYADQANFLNCVIEIKTNLSPQELLVYCKTEIDGYEENFKKLLWGWQAGMGFDFWILTIDLRYEGNFSKFGNHIKFGNKNYSFSDNPQRLIASLGVAF